MELLTPPFTPVTQPAFIADRHASTSTQSKAGSGSLPNPTRPMFTSRVAPGGLISPPISPDFALPPPRITDELPPLTLPEPSLPLDHLNRSYTECFGQDEDLVSEACEDGERYTWRSDMNADEREAREDWISQGRGRSGLRIVIVTENFLPKVDGVTRTLARLLEHLEREGHSCMLLGPGTGMSHYASHPLVGTAGVPLVVYPGLKLNFLRPKFMRTIRDFQPDVVHFVDPIWLGAQTLMAMELGWAGEEWVSEEGPALGAGIRGAVVASYHTNLATYATLFGMSWLEPIMWRFQRWLYSKTLLTLCPSPSTRHMLEDQSFGGVRLWPRGVDLSQFGPSNRSAARRASWGVGAAPAEPVAAKPITSQYQGPKVVLPMTPPASPYVEAVGAAPGYAAPRPFETGDTILPERIVLLYVGRISWEKNLHLLLASYKRLGAHLTSGGLPPKLVFVGDGPAKLELEAICSAQGFDAVFMGHRSGKELAECYASADIFAFPSFTETFGQVVLEALASGLPVVGLDAEGTRDLVSHETTGLLLRLPTEFGAGLTWPMACRSRDTPMFDRLAEEYSQLLLQASTAHAARFRMGRVASTEGIRGYTWWDAMERCVDGYRESIRLSREKRAVEVVVHSTIDEGEGNVAVVPPASPRIGRVNRVVSRRLAKGQWRETAFTKVVKRAKSDTAETIWHLKTLFKAAIVLSLFYAIYSHHTASKASASLSILSEI